MLTLCIPMRRIILNRAIENCVPIIANCAICMPIIDHVRTQRQKICRFIKIKIISVERGVANFFYHNKRRQAPDSV
jgi:hypothetical protein